MPPRAYEKRCAGSLLGAIGKVSIASASPALAGVAKGYTVGTARLQLMRVKMNNEFQLVATLDSPMDFLRCSSSNEEV